MDRSTVGSEYHLQRAVEPPGRKQGGYRVTHSWKGRELNDGKFLLVEHGQGEFVTSPQIQRSWRREHPFISRCAICKFSYSNSTTHGDPNLTTHYYSNNTTQCFIPGKSARWLDLNSRAFKKPWLMLGALHNSQEYLNKPTIHKQEQRLCVVSFRSLNCSVNEIMKWDIDRLSKVHLLNSRFDLPPSNIQTKTAFRTISRLTLSHAQLFLGPSRKHGATVWAHLFQYQMDQTLPSIRSEYWRVAFRLYQPFFNLHPKERSDRTTGNKLPLNIFVDEHAQLSMFRERTGRDMITQLCSCTAAHVWVRIWTVPRKPSDM